MNLKEDFETMTNYQDFLSKKENVEHASPDEYPFLYPTLDDPLFNVKIAEKKEFADHPYDGSIDNPIEKAEKMCNAEFELAPHQLFVRNFLSFNTPYNSLLLYHGLGTGKTCSAITVSEEMRDYMRQMGISQRIIIVASPNVQENFKLQLFDESKLKQVNGHWNIRACTGNKYLKEINPTNMKGLSKVKVINQIMRIINNYYLFMGYTEFSNYIAKQTTVDGEGLSASKREALRKKKLRRAFEKRLIVIDEVHNIRISDDNKNKRIAQNLIQLVKNVDGLRLLLLSATPMYNSYKEIIWLVNLMNANDRRSQLSIKEVFDNNGDFILNDRGEEIGKELLIQKATGYISFVRGENPFTFPYRIFPSLFSPQNSITNHAYPKLGLNGKPIIQSIEHLDLYVVGIGGYQNTGYQYIIDSMADSMDDKVEFENMERFGYTMLQHPLEALNIVFPIHGLGDEGFKVNSLELVGKGGLRRTMTHKESTSPPGKFDYEYKRETLDEFGRFFQPDKIGKYSNKIKSICDSVQQSEGIVLVYSQFIDGGLVPLALALEEMGFKRYGETRSLLKTPPESNGMTYCMITGDKLLSPDNVGELKALTSEDNTRGEKVKVVFISKAGAEGLDFKNIRQIHILEPWYNTNRIEQIIGRGVRTCSHKNLPFEERNVMIYLYGTALANELEAADMYIYRLADLKAIQIGRVSRVLKQTAIDCILNHGQTNFSEDKINMEVELKLGNGITIPYRIGDKPYSAACDYMKTCEYSCRPNKDITESNMNTYNSSFLMLNNDRIIRRIKGLFKERYFYPIDLLIAEVNVVRVYPTMQIYAALDQMLNDSNEYLIDRYNRTGRLVNVGEYYFYQPSEIDTSRITMFERDRPIDVKRESLQIELPKKLEEKSDEGIEKIVNDLYKKGTTEIETERGETDWYLFSALIIRQIAGDEDVREPNTLNELILEHIIESLTPKNKLQLMNIVYFEESTPFREMVKNYFDKQIITNEDLKGIFLLEEKKYRLFILGESSWKPGEAEDIKDLAQILKEKIESVSSNFAPYVGFMAEFKTSGMVFKIKDTLAKRTRGARCDQSGKSNAIRIINKITGEERLSSENTSNKNIHELCVYQELILRYYNKIRDNDKTWFISPEMAKILNI